jgi:molybdopterin synthase sulfur carrier subunit
MKIQMFAVLKNYFKEEMVLDATDIYVVSDLIAKLSMLNPDAAMVLKRCRIAVALNIVSGNYKLKEDDIISIIPPSSGG